jgi:hypothetical protein
MIYRIKAIVLVSVTPVYSRFSGETDPGIYKNKKIFINV